MNWHGSLDSSHGCASKRHVLQNIKTYRIGGALCAESAIFGYGQWYLGGLEQHLPDIFVRSVEEPAQGPVLCRIKLSQIEVPLVAGEDLADEHDLDYVDKLELLVHQGLGTGLESGQLFRITP